MNQLEHRVNEGQRSVNNAAVQDLVNRITEDFKAGKVPIPVLPDIVFKVRKAAEDEAVGFLKLAKLVQTDPGIAARLIHVANSAMYGTNKVDSCQDAISRLGLRLVRDLVLSLALEAIYRSKSAAITQRLKQAWEHNVYVAAISYVISDHTRGVDRDRAMMAGLVHDIGKLPVLYYAADNKVLRENAKVLEVVLSKLAGRLGQAVLRKWRFTDEMVAVPEACRVWKRDTGEEADLADVVLVARALALVGKNNGSSKLSLDDMPAFHKFRFARFGHEGALELLEEASDEIGEVMSWLSGR